MANKKQTKNKSDRYYSAGFPSGKAVGVAVFSVLAILTAVSIFNTDGSFTRFIALFLKGMIGWGFFVCPVIFVICAFILGFNQDKPAVERLICANILPVLFSAFISIAKFSYTDIATLTFTEKIGRLFELGQSLEAGGCLGGLIGIALEESVSIFGAYPLLVLAIVVLGIKTSGLTIGEFINTLTSSQDSKKKTSSGKAEKKASRQEQMFQEVPLNSVKKKDSVISDAPKKKSSVFSVDIPLDEEDDDDYFTSGAGAKKKVKVSRTKAAESETSLSEKKPMLSQKENVPIIVDDFDSDEVLEPVVSTTKTVKAKKKAGSPTDSVKPVSLDEAEKISGTVQPKKTEPVKNVKQENTKKQTKAVIEDKEPLSVPSASDEESEYVFPPVSLLNPPVTNTGDAREELMTNRSRLEAALHSFGINSSITSIIHGPTVTRYEIELEQGVKLSRVTNLAGDLALSLGVVNVRIAPIPEKISTVGIEVPNKLVNTVYLREIIDSDKFKKAKSKLSFAIGKDISGECVVGNISKLPHMLIAGTTGSGKSVCMNSLIISLIYKSSPDDVKMIMIDPKMVELGAYNGIGHLYVPVVTDPKKAAGALQWSVVEMLKRYRLFSEMGVRDLETYNTKALAAGEQKLPYVVIVIDELADLMIAASKDVEESICRVAQMGRAAGMHLIIATQRPSADVITGLMKANIPSRIAFAVSSAMESRIILDQTGAEKLIGMGDMLYSPVGVGKPVRIQGAFVTDEERESIIDFIKENSSNTSQSEDIIEYMNKALEGKNSGSGSSSAEKESTGSSSDYDEKIHEAVYAVIEMKSCSVSMLQRKVKLGYSRAARIVDQMEELGVVGPYEGAKPRSVLIDKSGWRSICSEIGLEIPDEFYDDAGYDGEE